jgi:hypothetical protein
MTIGAQILEYSRLACPERPKEALRCENGDAGSSKLLRQSSIAAARGRSPPPPKLAAIKRFPKDSHKPVLDLVNPLWGCGSFASIPLYDFPVIAFSIPATTLRIKANMPE